MMHTEEYKNAPIVFEIIENNHSDKYGRDNSTNINKDTNIQRKHTDNKGCYKMNDGDFMGQNNTAVRKDFIQDKLKNNRKVQIEGNLNSKNEEDEIEILYEKRNKRETYSKSNLDKLKPNHLKRSDEDEQKKNNDVALKKIEFGEYQFYCEESEYNAILELIESSRFKNVQFCKDNQVVQKEKVDQILIQKNSDDKEKLFKYYNYKHNKRDEFNPAETYENVGEYRFHCVYCDYMAESDSFLINHQSVHTFLFARTIDQNQPGMQGKDIASRNDSSYRNPVFSHDKTQSKNQDSLLQCDVCDYVTYNPSFLISHEMEHTKEKIFHCLLCNLKTFSRITFLRHYSVRHMNN